MSKMTPQIRFQGFTDDWEQYNLGELTSWNKGQGLSKDKLTNNGIGDPALHYADLYKFRPVTGYVIHWTNSKEGRPIPNNSILFPASDVTPKGLARTTTLDIPGVKAGGDVIIGQLQQEINAKFLSYQINANSNQILPLITGTTVKHIQSKNLSTLKVTIPNKDEQNVISRLFDDFENLIVLHQCKLELLKKQKKGFLQKMFPKNGAKVPKLRFSGFADDWEERKLIEVADYRNGKAHEKDISEDGYYIVVNSKFVSTNGLVKKYSDKMIAPLSKNEIAFVLSDVPNGRAIARTFLINEDNKYSLNQRIAGITPHADTNSYFLHSLMNRNHYFLRFDDGVSQTNLSKREVEKWVEFYPSYQEQQKIGSFFKQLDDTIALHQRKLDLLKEQKKGFLQKMFVS
ncbi:restriction endonuclease subunit S [Leuconostoc mesenteroides]|uniref:restriction endonuclease subunit S n=1 Tax=Leuconostoc mesenteroides TaxID=1245 RepID=UPI0021A4FE3F|nr:restriction endonuclease subunit S [Leuconostoc mesenteroides]MCT3039260.1 restriction endonuclease subunit S [Leuconostoc mesenteroides]